MAEPSASSPASASCGPVPVPDPAPDTGSSAADKPGSAPGAAADSCAGSTVETLFIAPVPPPVHGGALAMQFLLPMAEECHIRHINSQFAAGLNDLGAFSLRKAFRLGRYAAQLVREVFTRKVRTVVLTPTFYLGPFVKDAVFIWLASAVLRRRCVAWFHMDFRIMRYESRPAWVRALVRHTLLRCERFVVVSDGLKPLLPAWIPAERVDAVANGVEVPGALLANPPERSAAGAGEKVRVLYLSNLEEAKGWRVLLEAAREICAAFPEVEFILHGNPAFGETADGIRAEIDKNPAGGRIVFKGPAYGAEKWKAFAEADLFCFPSFHEAFPLAVLEAMASGLPIVASRVGAVADAVEDGRGGHLVEPRDAGPLAVALRSLVADAALRRGCGTFNRARFLERYTLAAYQERWRQWLRTEAARAV